jgi:hypothetical protein
MMTEINSQADDAIDCSKVSTIPAARADLPAARTNTPVSDNWNPFESPSAPLLRLMLVFSCMLPNRI